MAVDLINLLLHLGRKVVILIQQAKPVRNFIDAEHDRFTVAQRVHWRPPMFKIYQILQS